MKRAFATMASSDTEFERKCAAIAINPVQLKNEIPLLRNKEKKRDLAVSVEHLVGWYMYMYSVVWCLYSVHDNVMVMIFRSNSKCT